MNFAVIGVGSFGLKRAAAIKDSKFGNLKTIHDTSNSNLQKASEKLNVKSDNLKNILSDKSIETICICAPNKFNQTYTCFSKKALINIIDKWNNKYKDDKIVYDNNTKKKNL